MLGKQVCITRIRFNNGKVYHVPTVMFDESPPHKSRATFFLCKNGETYDLYDNNTFSADGAFVMKHGFSSVDQAKEECAKYLELSPQKVEETIIAI